MARRFWGKQPVPSLKDPAPEDAEDGEIDEPKTVDDVKKEPSKLPGSFESRRGCGMRDPGDAARGCGSQCTSVAG